MSWEDIDNKIKKKIDANFVSCSEQWELDYVRDCISEAFPKIDVADIDSAIGWCCGEVDGNRPREEFLKCVRDNL